MIVGLLKRFCIEKHVIKTLIYIHIFFISELQREFQYGRSYREDIGYPSMPLRTNDRWLPPANWKGLFRQTWSWKQHQVAPVVSMYIPWQIFRFIVTLCGTYGALIHNTKPKKGRVYIILESDETAQKIFDPWRFDGTNYLSKRQYKKVPGLDKKLTTVYGGRAIVPVTMETPIRLEYVLSTNIVKITFYIQRYTADDLAIDAHVQTLIDRDYQLQEMDAE